MDVITLHSLLSALAMIIISFVLGYNDGYMKLHYTVNHFAKWPMYLALGYIAITAAPIIALIGWSIMFKPVFDIGWSIGAGYKCIFIGQTSWTDRILHKIGLVEFSKTQMPMLTFIYLSMILCGFMLICYQDVISI